MIVTTTIYRPGGHVVNLELVESSGDLIQHIDNAKALGHPVSVVARGVTVFSNVPLSDDPRIDLIRLLIRQIGDEARINEAVLRSLPELDDDGNSALCSWVSRARTMDSLYAISGLDVNEMKRSIGGDILGHFCTEFETLNKSD